MPTKNEPEWLKEIASWALDDEVVIEPTPNLAFKQLIAHVRELRFLLFGCRESQRDPQTNRVTDLGRRIQEVLLRSGPPEVR